MRVSRLEADYTAFSYYLLQDKQEVEAYKAKIKAQLTSAGLIRGQPRSSQTRPAAVTMVSSQMSPQTYRQPSPPDISSSSTLLFEQSDYLRYYDAAQEQHHRHNHNVIPGMPGKLLFAVLAP
jgi:hypothetical protein